MIVLRRLSLSLSLSLSLCLCLSVCVFTSSTVTVFNFVRPPSAPSQYFLSVCGDFFASFAAVATPRGAMASQSESLNAPFDMSQHAWLLAPLRDLSDNWDVDLAGDLNEYLDTLAELEFTFDGGDTTLNFAEGAPDGYRRSPGVQEDCMALCGTRGHTNDCIRLSLNCHFHVPIGLSVHALYSCASHSGFGVRVQQESGIPPRARIPRAGGHHVQEEKGRGAGSR